MGKILFDILEINIVVSVVILLVVPATEFLRKRYGARWLRVVWIILAVRLLIPYNFSLPNTEIRFFDIPGFEQEVGVVSQQEAFDGIIFMGVKGLSQTQDLVESSTNEIVINEDVYLNDGMLIDADEVSGLSPNSNAVSQENSLEGNENGSVADIEGKTEQFETSGFEYTQFMLLMWGIGAVIFVVYYAIVYIYFRIKCHKSMHLLNDLNLQRYTDEVQLKYLGKVKCNVYESDVVVTPMLVGLVAPKLVLPSGKNVMEPTGKQLQTTKWTPEELKLVVAHEICHYKSRDLWFKIIMLLACCINWFNPLVHIMKKKFYYDIELACDYRVLCNCDETQREQYAKTLLKFAGREYAFATGLSANKKRLKKRIGYIWERKEKRAGVAATCFVFFMLIGAGLFISCGYKPGESNDGLEKHPEYAFEETSEAADVEVRKEFTYNNETNEMVRYYEETTYVARRDGIYQIVDGEMVCIYSNEYGFNRGMELYKDFLYFCGTSSSKTSEDGYLTATVYRINLNISSATCLSGILRTPRETT